MKTPDETKKGLECCVIGASAHQPKCRECPYELVITCSDELLKDAAGLVQRFEAERDALIEEMKNAHSCFACKKFHRNGGVCVGGSVCLMRGFEWRGVQKEEPPIGGNSDDFVHGNHG